MLGTTPGILLFEMTHFGVFICDYYSKSFFCSKFAKMTLFPTL